jgi:hypothetical protein
MFDAGFGAKYLMAQTYDPPESTGVLNGQYEPDSLLWRLQQELRASKARADNSSKMQARKATA